METARVLTISGLHPHCQGHIAILDSKLRSNETMFKQHQMDIAKTTWNEIQRFATHRRCRWSICRWCLMRTRWRQGWGRIWQRRKLVKVPNFRQFGFSAKRDRFVEVCWGGPRLPRALLIRGGLSESDTAIMLGQAPANVPKYTQI